MLARIACELAKLGGGRKFVGTGSAMPTAGWSVITQDSKLTQLRGSEKVVYEVCMLGGGEKVVSGVRKPMAKHEQLI